MSNNKMVSLHVEGLMFMTSLPTFQSFPLALAGLALIFIVLPSSNCHPDSAVSFIDWWRHKQFLVDRVNMDWDGLKVVANCLGT